MNRNDTIKVRGALAELVHDLEIRKGDTSDPKAQQKLDRRIRELTELYQRAKIRPLTPSTAPKTVSVGSCACGAPVTLGDRYSVPVEGHQTVKRACPKCSRTNEVELTLRREFKPVDWKVADCFCESPVYVRSEYAGSGFSGYQGPRDLAGLTRKNRTTSTDCRRCGCTWTFKIRFTEVKTGEDAGQLRRSLSTVVKRCGRCRKLEIDGLTPVEPKLKRAKTG